MMTKKEYEMLRILAECYNFLNRIATNSDITIRLREYLRPYLKTPTQVSENEDPKKNPICDL